MWLVSKKSKRVLCYIICHIFQVGIYLFYHMKKCIMAGACDKMISKIEFDWQVKTTLCYAPLENMEI